MLPPNAFFRHDAIMRILIIGALVLVLAAPAFAGDATPGGQFRPQPEIQTQPQSQSQQSPAIDMDRLMQELRDLDSSHPLTRPLPGGCQSASWMTVTPRAAGRVQSIAVRICVPFLPSSESGKLMKVTVTCFWPAQRRSPDRREISILRLVIS